MSSLKEYWEGLPKWAKIGIPVAAGGAVILGLVKKGTSSGTTTTPAAATGSISDGTGGGVLTPSSYYDPSAYTSDANSMVQSSLTQFQDDLMKQQQANAQAAAGFQAQIQALMGQLANLHTLPDPHTSVTSYAASPISDNTPSSSGSHGTTDLTPILVPTTNVNGTIVTGKYSNTNSNTHTYTAPGIGTFEHQDGPGATALPPGATLVN